MSPAMDTSRQGRTRWAWVVLSSIGGVLLLWFWTAWLGFAVDESALPANASSLRLLVGLIAAQGAGTVIYLMLMAAWTQRRPALLRVLPWLVWGLVGLNAALLSISGFY
jgi:hypothetical protein